MDEVTKGPAKLLKKILTVCTGNICRSPMAEGILRQLLAGTPGVTVSSAGTHALIGNPATEFAIIAAAENGIDISSHRARLVGAELVRESSLIFCMELFQVESVLEFDPSAGTKTFSLADFAGDGKMLEKIPDPYGCSLREYRSCFSDIDRCIRNFLARGHFEHPRMSR
jgi:protein-tyrosine-phosphatase